MELDLVKQLVLIFIDTLGIVLVWWVLKSSRDPKLSFWFGLMTIFMLLWANFAYFGSSSSDLGYALAWYRLNWAAVSLFFIPFFIFTMSLLRKNSQARIVGYVISVISVGFFLLSLFSDSIIKSVVARDWGVEVLFGPVDNFFNIFSLFVVGAVLYYSVAGYGSLSQEMKMKLQYLFIGLFIFVLANVVFNVLFVTFFDSLKYQSFGDFASIFFLGFTAYAIVKRDLFGARVVFSGLLVISIAILLVVDIFLFTDNMIFRFFKGIILVLFLYFGRMLVRSVLMEIARRKQLEEKNQSLLVLQDLSKITLETVQFKDLVRNILKSTPAHLGYTMAMLALIDHKKDFVTIEGISVSGKFRGALESLEKDPVGMGFSFSKSDNNIVRAAKNCTYLVGENIKDFLCPPFDLGYAESVQNAFHCNSIAAFPVRTMSQEVRGVIIFGLDKVISDQDIELMTTFSNYAGIALGRMEVLDRLRMFNIELVSANKHLKELDRLKDDFVSVASHELRTPMTSIKSYLWMAIAGQGGPLNEKQKYYSERAYASVERLIKLVNDMLNISRIESGRLTVEMGSVDIVKLVRDVVEEVGPRSKELGVSVDVEVEGDIPLVLADSDKIKEVIYNLVGNSMKFSQSGGKIVVGIRKKDGMVELSVKDEGAGIASEDLPKLFQKFGILPGSYVTNQPAMGTGLGLYICRSLVELHGGKIWAASDGQGKGATFAFTLKEFSEDDLRKVNEKYKQSDKKVDLISSKIF